MDYIQDRRVTDDIVHTCQSQPHKKGQYRSAPGNVINPKNHRVPVSGLVKQAQKAVFTAKAAKQGFVYLDIQDGQD